jgi:hypothetical protein
MRFASTSITVTGIETPASVKIRVMPHFLPTKPIAILNLFISSINGLGVVAY